MQDCIGKMWGICDRPRHVVLVSLVVALYRQDFPCRGCGCEAQWRQDQDEVCTSVCWNI